MKNRGFTLVELLAVIAILAILVIVAMPNVLGMFNQAKVNSFVTEVQKIMDTAITTFTKDALVNSGKTVYYSSENNATLKTKQLDMSGNKKNYFIEMDRNGEFKRVVVSDANYCYDIYSSGTNGRLDSSNSKLIVDKINKTSVVVSDVWEAGNDSISVTINGTNYVVKGCEGVITAEGKSTNVSLEIVKIGTKDYYYEPGMIWEEWSNSEYNIDNYYWSWGLLDSTGTKKVEHNTYCVDLRTGYFYSIIVGKDDYITLNETYGYSRPDESNMSGSAVVGNEYYNCSDTEPVKFIMEKVIYN